MGDKILCQLVTNSPGATVVNSLKAGDNATFYFNSSGGLVTEPEEPDDTPVFQASTSRLPLVGEHFLGRDERMADLDAAWADGELNVLSLVADGGVVDAETARSNGC